MFFIHLLYSIRTPIIRFPRPSKPDRRNVGWYVAMKKSTEAKCRYTAQTIKSNPGLDGIVAFEGVYPTDMSKNI